MGRHASARSAVARAFCSGWTVTIPNAHSQQQVQFTRSLSSCNGFVAYIDAIGALDGPPCVLEWKTSSARYSEEPVGLAALDSQLVCYSWMTGIDEVSYLLHDSSWETFQFQKLLRIFQVGGKITMSFEKKYVRNGRNQVVGSVTSGFNDESSVVRDSQNRILGRTSDRFHLTRRADNSLVSNNTADPGLLFGDDED
jgi:hypothetical protein